MITLANAWAAAGRPVTILAFDAEREPFFEVHPEVVVRHLDLMASSSGFVSAVRNNLRRIAVVRRAIRQSRPDIVISFMDRTSIVVLLAMLGRRTPVVVSDRTSKDPTSGRIWQALRRITYRRAAAIVLQTRAMAGQIYPELRSRVTVIPNPVPSDFGGPGDPVDDAPPRAGLVVALGRLVPQKGYDLLVEAYAEVAPRQPDARLEIWGAGPEEASLAAQIERLGLADRVSLRGETDKPKEVLQQASIVVLSSRIEGFPNVLLEAMALGRPVVAVDCSYGPAEIVRDGVDGYLVAERDPIALARAIVSLLGSSSDRERMGRRGTEVRERFGIDRVMEGWNSLIGTVLESRAAR
jgi:glycosyltransferase involved in cell wall biosynthesis